MQKVLNTLKDLETQLTTEKLSVLFQEAHS